MSEDFILASQDLGPNWEPRRCRIIDNIQGTRSNSRYLYVDINPPLMASFLDGPETEYNRIILLAAKGQKISDIGMKSVIADIVICPTFSSGTLDESKCAKIGTGSLYKTYEEALLNPQRSRRVLHE